MYALILLGILSILIIIDKFIGLEKVFYQALDFKKFRYCYCIFTALRCMMNKIQVVLDLSI